MKFLSCNHSTRYFFIALVFFFGGCLFSDTTVSGDNNGDSKVCPESVPLIEALDLQCDFFCSNDVDCDDEIGFRCEENVCVQYCDTGCEIDEPNCVRCVGESCNADMDCESLVCSNNACVSGIPSCENGEMDPGEDGIDCGGTCKDCVENFCDSDVDCLEGVCINGVCEDCSCGEVGCGACDGEVCTSDNECESNFCLDDVCRPDTCDNGMKDGDEVGPDCGGGCLACPLSNCDDNVDCLSGLCSDVGKCVPKSCRGIPPGLHVIAAGEPNDSSRYEVHCGREGWTLLGQSAANSTQWSHNGEFWEGENMNETPGNPLDGTLTSRSVAYRALAIKEIKLCFMNQETCFVFKLNASSSMLNFMKNETLQLPITAVPDFLKNLEFEVIKPDQPRDRIQCLRVGINHQNGSKIGLVGDTSRCVNVGENGADDLALGLGMTSTSTALDFAVSNTSGYARYVHQAGQLAPSAPNDQSLGPWFIFGR